jgi:hypothetical protein
LEEAQLAYSHLSYTLTPAKKILLAYCYSRNEGTPSIIWQRLTSMKLRDIMEKMRDALG